VRLLTKSSLSTLVLLSCAGSALATPIAGTFRFNGAAVITEQMTDFTAASGDPRLTATEGDIVFANAGNTGDFAFLDGPFKFGDLEDRDANVQRTGQLLNVPSYLEFYDRPNWNFVLTRVQPGVYNQAQCFAAPANEQTCTPPPQPATQPPPGELVSPYNLANYNDIVNGVATLSSSATFSVEGYVENLDDLGNVTGVSRFSGTFAAVFQGRSYQEVLTAVLAGIPVTTAYGAEFVVTAIPEPSTLGFTGIALIGLAAAARRLRS
jgi:hypothetical protein